MEEKIPCLILDDNNTNQITLPVKESGFYLVSFIEPSNYNKINISTNVIKSLYNKIIVYLNKKTNGQAILYNDDFKVELIETKQPKIVKKIKGETKNGKKES